MRRSSDETGYIETPEGQVHYRTEGNGDRCFYFIKQGYRQIEFTEMLPFSGKNTACCYGCARIWKHKICRYLNQVLMTM